MANNCYYEMKVCGCSDNVDEFVRIIQDNGGSQQRRLSRVFSADIFEEYVDEPNIKTVCLCGDCAWSIYSSMRQISGGNSGHTSLRTESEWLSLAIEVYSSEPGSCFMEHYACVNGEEIIDDCVDYYEYWPSDYSSLDELNKVCGTAFTENDIHGDGAIRVGGLVWDFCDYRERFNPICEIARRERRGKDSYYHSQTSLDDII